MYSKSPTLRTVSLPPFWPPSPVDELPPPPPSSSSPPQAARPTVSASRAAATSANHFFVLMNPSFRIAYRGRGWGLGSGRSPARPRVEGVLQAVAEQVEGQHGGEKGQAGEEHVPPGGVEDRGGVGDHRAPARVRLLDADAEERQRRLEQDVGRDDQRAVHDQRRDQVGQDLAKHDA